MRQRDAFDVCCFRHAMFAVCRCRFAFRHAMLPCQMLAATMLLLMPLPLPLFPLATYTALLRCCCLHADIFAVRRCDAMPHILADFADAIEIDRDTPRYRC